MDAAGIELVTRLASGGFAVALLALIYIVGMRMVTAISKLVDAIGEHAKEDAANHASTREELIELRAHVQLAAQPRTVQRAR